jgi:hypothetical protein
MTAKTKTSAGPGARHDRIVQEYQHETSRLSRVTLVVLSVILLVACSVGIMTAEAKIVVPPTGSVIEVDQATLKAVLDAFEQAEEAIKAHDLDKVMGMYSSHYNYHGLKKDDVRKIWKALFDEYQEIASTHLFTKITKVGAGRDAVLEVTCTGHLWAKSKTSGLYVPIDSWHEEIHYLVLEDKDWRLRGNVGESPRVLPFGTAPHPLF